MGILTRVADGMVNLVANLGTARDKAAHSHYVVDVLSPHELSSMYRTSWLARATVDQPAEDAVRKWRRWQAEADQITKIEAEETRLKLQRRVMDALIAGRLYGSALIYINTGTDAPDEPLQVGDEVRSLVVLTPSEVSVSEIIRDIDSEYYGQPEHYVLSSGKSTARIHATRFVRFDGARNPQTNTGVIWGDSVLQSTLDAIRNVDSAMANIVSLIFEAKVDVFKFDGFAQMMADNADEAVMRRLHLQAAMKGINGAVVIDALDSYDQKTANFGSLPEVVSKFMDAVSGASGIPVTRLYGRAAVGLSGSGDGDERVYFDRIGHIQATEITPAMSLLDQCIVAQALGKPAPDVFYNWAPLRQITESERADIFSKTAAAARALAGGAGEVIPLDALSDALVNEFVEQGVLPGLEQAIKEHGRLSEQFLEGDE